MSPRLADPSRVLLYLGFLSSPCLVLSVGCEVAGRAPGGGDIQSESVTSAGGAGAGSSSEKDGSATTSAWESTTTTETESSPTTSDESESPDLEDSTSGDGQGTDGGGSGGARSANTPDPNCDDGLSCTRDLVDSSGKCSHPVEDGYCVIDDECITEGESPEGNPCRMCDPAADDRSWTFDDPGTACGFCHECSTEGACQPASSCCAVGQMSANFNGCGYFEEQDDLVESGCQAKVVKSVETPHKRTSSTVYLSCVDGAWSSTGSGGSAYGSFEPKLTSSIDWDEELCGPQVEDSPTDEECAACEITTLPTSLRIGACDTFDSHLVGALGEGAIFGRRSCEDGSTQCEETTVVCHNHNWVTSLTTEVTRSHDSEFSDTWFIRTGDIETALQEAKCAERGCQLLSLGATTAYGYCNAPSSPSFAVGDTYRHKFNYTLPDNSGNGTSAIYSCESSGWIEKQPTLGTGSPCSNCGYDFTWERYRNDVLDDAITCNSSCDTSEASFHKSSSGSGVQDIVPAGNRYSLCQYLTGKLYHSQMSACSTFPTGQNEWQSLGKDNSCPATVSEQQELAAADENIEPCTSEDCHFWRSSWGNLTKTISF